MKEVINLQGQKEMVSKDTPVKTVDGVYYLLKPSDNAELAQYNAEQAQTNARLSVLRKIRKLENQVTIRRLREAILGIDNGWLANQESLIAAERSKL